jgi:hypothetical protein
MFPVDVFPPVYCEERLKDTEAKRKLEQEQAAKQAMVAQQQPQATQRPQGHSLTQALLQRPPLSRPVSSAVLGNIWQGFVSAKSAHATPTPAQGGAAPGLTPEQAEKMREADIVRFSRLSHLHDISLTGTQCANAMRPW